MNFLKYFYLGALSAVLIFGNLYIFLPMLILYLTFSFSFFALALALLYDLLFSLNYFLNKDLYISVFLIALFYASLAKFIREKFIWS